MKQIIKTRWAARFPKYNSMAYYFADTKAQAIKLAEDKMFDTLFDFTQKESWTEYELVEISCTENEIIVNGKCKKIVYDHEWYTKVLKTQIKSNRTAENLLGELTKSSKETALSCIHIHIIENIEQEGKIFVA